MLLFAIYTSQQRRTLFTFCAAARTQRMPRLSDVVCVDTLPDAGPTLVKASKLTRFIFTVLGQNK